MTPKDITDLKLVPKRRFGFVGYKDEQLAQKALEWFDGTYAFGGGKVKVELVRDEVSPGTDPVVRVCGAASLDCH